MSNVKKAVVLILAILVVLAFATNNSILASTIPTRNTNNNSSNNVSNNASNSSNNVSNNNSNNTSNEPTNNVSNTPVNNSFGNASFNNARNNASPINSTNSEENIPHTGIADTYFSFALIILLAVVLGMFSFVQYSKITKKENDD